jgi:hypothetical protein
LQLAVATAEKGGSDPALDFCLLVRESVRHHDLRDVFDKPEEAEVVPVFKTYFKAMG